MKIKNFIHRLLVKLHLKQDYGFTQLMYRGLPVIRRDDMPIDNIGFIYEKTARVRVLNWKTGKRGKLMTFRQFDRWIVKQNERASKKA